LFNLLLLDICCWILSCTSESPWTTHEWSWWFCPIYVSKLAYKNDRSW